MRQVKFSNVRRERAAIERELLEENLKALEALERRGQKLEIGVVIGKNGAHLALDEGADGTAYLRGRLFSMVVHHMHESGLSSDGGRN